MKDYRVPVLKILNSKLLNETFVMKRLLRFFTTGLMCVFALSLYSCNEEIPGGEEEEVVLILSTDSLEFDWNAGQEEVTVTGADWTADVDETWVSINPKSDTDGIITVSVIANDIESPRSATLTVTNAAGTKTVGIEQKAKPAPAELIVGAEAIDFIFVGGSETVTVTSAIQWTVTSDAPEWLTVEKTAEGEFTATAIANDGDARTAVITVDNGETVKEIAVSQEQDYGELFVSADGKYLGASWGPGTGDFELELLTFEKLEGGGVSHAGYALYLNPITEVPDFTEWCISMTSGTYSISESCEAMTLYPGYQYVVPVDADGKGGKYVDVVSGTLTIEGTYADYTIIIDFVLKDGTELKGIYRGPLLIRNPNKLSDFTEDLDITLTQGNLNFFMVYQETIDIWHPQFMTSGIYVEDGYLAGDGYVFMSEMYSTTTGGKSFPDGDYTIVPRGTPTAPFTAYTGFEYNGTRYATWIMEIKDGDITKAAPIVSGTITMGNSGGTVVLDALDDIGNSMKATYSGTPSAVMAPVNPTVVKLRENRVGAFTHNSTLSVSKPAGRAYVERL